MSGAAEGEADLVPAGERVRVVGPEQPLPFGGDRAVDLARLGPPAEPSEAQSGVVPPGQRGDRLRRGSGPFAATGEGRDGGGRAGGPLAGESGGRVGRGTAPSRARGLVAGGHALGPGRQPGCAGGPSIGRGREPRCRGGPFGGGVRRGRGDHGRHVHRCGAPGGDAAGEFAGVLRALLGLFGEQVEDDPLQVLGDVGPAAAGRLGHGVAVADEDGPGVAEIERRGSGGDLVEHAPEGVEVAALVDLRAADLFRRHVVRGAHSDAGAGEARGEPDVVAEPGDAEVADLHGAVRQPHDVRRLQVTVHDALLVGVGERGGHLVGDVDDLVDRERLPVRLHQLAEVVSLQQFHHQVQHPVGLAEVVDDGHSAVLQGRRDPGLAPEPFTQDAGEGRVVVRAERLQALDGHLAAQ